MTSAFYKKSCKRALSVFLFWLTFAGVAYAGQTGKIAGRVTDAATGETLPGANIVIEGTTLGAASDVDGDYIILNVPPGTYTLVASMLSYGDMRVTKVRVSVDQTTRIDFKLQPTTLELGETIVVEAKQPLIQKDMTATASSVSAEEIQQMPVENFSDILQLQAGIVKDNRGEFHIRGGRSSEIAYLVDGVSVTDPYSGQIAVSVDQSSIQELKVISGTFNAEYGQVMSGIVEIITKDPEARLDFGGTVYSGDYVSKHSDLFYNIGDVNLSQIYNWQFYVTGPVPIFKNKLSYYLAFRRNYTDGWLYGQRRFNPSDSSHFDPKAAYVEQTGDNKPVPMNFRNEAYGNLKIIFKPVPAIKINYSVLGNRFRYKNYNHLFKYNPDGDVTNREYGVTNMLILKHALSAETFYTAKISRYYYDFKSYLYGDLDDQRYINPEILRNREDAFSFLTGGTNMTHFYRSTRVDIFKFDITSQVTKLHQIKAGMEYKSNRIHLKSQEARYRGKEGGGIFNSAAFFNRGEYTHRPVEASAYIQDKIELNNMTVNIGLRYDYFNSRGIVPTDLRDPENVYRPRENAYGDASPRNQWSPRIGIAFPISANGVIHTSYGYFFQIPPYEFLYVNPRFAVAPGGLSTLMGNADLKPQTTIIYEVGFQQQLFEQIGIDVTGFYKDARNLLGTRIYETYVLGDRYARYENRDYGNIRGITISVNKRPTRWDHITVSFDYTFQAAEGNASDPNQEFYNQQSDPPRKSNIQVVPLNWDQRHTINLSVSYSNPRVFSLGIIGQFQSGLPYTPAIQSQETTFENSGRKPFNYDVDIRLSKVVNLGKSRFTFFMKVYNVFDRENELDVYSDTGRARYSLISHYIGERNAYVNTLDEWLKRPDFYSEPRKVLMGFEIKL